jgi:hypothetical protein|tara:strand:+ start:228 stop:473 length:246 start_codon:yes stop_codon:yes gene_type:complete
MDNDMFNELMTSVQEMDGIVKMVPDWILSLQSSATCARRLEMFKSFHWDEDDTNQLAELAAKIEGILAECEQLSTSMERQR